MFARIIIMVAALDVDVARIQFMHDLPEDAELKVLAVQQARRAAVGQHAAFPLFGNPVEWQLREIGIAQQQVLPARRSILLDPRERAEQRVILRTRLQRQQVEALKQQRSKLLVWREQEREDVVSGLRDVFVAPNEHAVRIIAQCGAHLRDPHGRRCFVILQDVENISELADEGLQLIGVCELVLLKPQLGCALEIPDRLDEYLGDIVECLLTLRENEQPRERICLTGFSARISWTSSARASVMNCIRLGTDNMCGAGGRPSASAFIVRICSRKLAISRGPGRFGSRFKSSQRACPARVRKSVSSRAFNGSSSESK